MIILPPLIGSDISPTEMSQQDGVRRFSNSEIQTAKRCKRKWWLSYYRKLQPLAKPHVGPLPIGSRIHRALQYHYQSRVPNAGPWVNARDALEVLIMHDREILINDPEFNDDIEEQFNKEADLQRIMIAGYLEWLEETGDDAKYEVIGAEAYSEVDIDTRDLPISIPVKIIARLDLRVRRLSDGLALFLDHKALRNGTPVLTPNGWIAIEHLQINDIIIAGDGTPTIVTGVYPQGSVNLYRVKFSDKTEIECSGDHLWYAQRYTRSRPEVINTHQLLVDLHDFHTVGSVQKKNNNWHIPVTSIEFDNDRDHVIDPYIIGVWIGDGGRMTTSFTSADHEIADNIISVLPSNLTLISRIVNEVHNSYNIVRSDSSYTNSFANELRRTKLWECGSHARFIPDEYLRSSFKHRLALLRGLMDTDGCIRTKTKQVLYITTSAQLRDDVAFLVRSLGGIACITNNGSGKYAHEGEIRICRTVYTVNIQLPAHINPFSLSRKAMVFDSKKSRHLKRWITDIEPIEADQATCISVAHSSQLYVTKDMIITHNTTASFTQLTKQLSMNEQMLFYMLIGYLHNQYTAGALYNMIRRVKRSAKSKPPFFDRVPVYHNRIELDAFHQRTKGVIGDIIMMEHRLNNGENHRRVVYPTPTANCSWDCPFYVPCKMMDDGSYAEEMLERLFAVGDPLAYYVGDGVTNDE